MKIFVTSDIHGNYDVIKKLEIVKEHADLVVICGDVGDEHDLHRVHDMLVGSDWIYIRGNCDDFDVSNDKNYLSEPKVFGRQDFIPFEGILTTPFNTYRETNEEGLQEQLSKIENTVASIIVAHNPPFCLGDEIAGSKINVGSKSISSFIANKKPKIYLCGHIHESYTNGEIGNSLVFNCACPGTGELRGWLIDTESLEFENVEI